MRPRNRARSDEAQGVRPWAHVTRTLSPRLPRVTRANRPRTAADPMRVGGQPGLGLARCALPNPWALFTRLTQAAAVVPGFAIHDVRVVGNFSAEKVAHRLPSEAGASVPGVGLEPTRGCPRRFLRPPQPEFLDALGSFTPIAELERDVGRTFTCRVRLTRVALM